MYTVYMYVYIKKHILFFFAMLLDAFPGISIHIATGNLIFPNQACIIVCCCMCATAVCRIIINIYEVMRRRQAPSQLVYGVRTWSTSRFHTYMYCMLDSSTQRSLIPVILAIMRGKPSPHTECCPALAYNEQHVTTATVNTVRVYADAHKYYMWYCCLLLYCVA